MAFVDVRGTKVFYESAGEGEPVVLVHGGFLDHNMWMLTVPLLAERFQVVTLDQPGAGMSGGSIDVNWTADEVMDTTVDHLSAFVEQLDLAPAHFAGQSFGGWSILHLAARRPDLIQSMSLHEPAVLAFLDEEFRSEREANLEAAALIIAGDTEVGLSKLVESVGGDWSQIPEPLKDIFRGNAKKMKGASFFADPALMLTVPEGLDQFPHPVQFTKGDLSPRFFHVSIDRLAALIPDTEIVTIKGGAHAAMLSQPDEYAASLSAFFERSSV